MKGKRDSAGMFLIELMIWVVLFGIFATSALSISTRMRALHRQTEAYANDLHSCRRAIAAIVRDSREADRVAVLPQGVDLALAGRGIRYQLQDGYLLRIEGGKVLQLSDRIGHIKVQCKERLLSIEIALKRRKKFPDARRAMLTTSVLMHNLRRPK